jgi:hypothetical protein
MSTRPPLLPLLLLVALTILTLAGPFAIFAVVRGGARPDWPPDRPVEWWVFWLVCGGYATLMVACIGVAAISLRRMKPSPTGVRPEVDASPSGGPPRA